MENDLLFHKIDVKEQLNVKSTALCRHDYLPESYKYPSAYNRNAVTLKGSIKYRKTYKMKSQDRCHCRWTIIFKGIL